MKRSVAAECCPRGEVSQLRGGEAAAVLAAATRLRRLLGREESQSPVQETLEAGAIAVLVPLLRAHDLTLVHEVRRSMTADR